MHGSEATFICPNNENTINVSDSHKMRQVVSKLIKLQLVLQILKNIDKKQKKTKLTDPKNGNYSLKDNVKQCSDNMEVSGTQLLTTVILERLGDLKFYQQRLRRMKKGDSG